MNEHLATYKLKIYLLAEKTLRQNPHIKQVRYFPHTRQWIVCNDGHLWSRGGDKTWTRCVYFKYRNGYVSRDNSIVGITSKGGWSRLQEANRYDEPRGLTDMTTKPDLQALTENFMIIQLEEGDMKKRSAVFHNADGEILGYFADSQVRIVTENDEAVEIKLTPEYIGRMKKIVDSAQLENDDSDFITNMIKIIGVKTKLMDK